MTTGNLMRHIWAAVFRVLPLTRWWAFKRSLLRLQGFHVGDEVRVFSSARFLTRGPVIVSAGTWIGHEFLVIGGQACVSIGPECDIGPRVTLATGTHEVLSGEARVAGRGRSEPIDIERGCWIGTGTVILGGSRIGACSIVAAGSVVRGEFPPRTLIAGVPAKVLKALS